MNARHPSQQNLAADLVSDVIVPARRWIASSIAVLMTSATLAIVGMPLVPSAPTLINGLTVTDFAPVVVTPTAAEQKAAAALGSVAAKALQATDSARAAQLGAQLAMPYYSFDSAAKGSKE